MYANVGFSVLIFSVAVLSVATLFLFLGGRVRTVRPIAIRLVVMFGIFAVAGAYVWTNAGPTADLKTEIKEMPTLPLPPPKYMWV